jgi:hypothetical protein
MLSGAISKSSKQKKTIDPKPTDPIKRRIRAKLDRMATVMGKIEDIVLTGDEKTDLTPLEDLEVKELYSLVKSCNEKMEDLEREVTRGRMEQP